VQQQQEQQQGPGLLQSHVPVYLLGTLLL
jgi:hypothetical protein